MTRRTRRAAWAATAATTLVLVAGCGDNGTQNSATCDKADQLKSSVSALEKVNVTENGLSALKTDLAQVKSDLNALAAAAKTQFQPQIQAVKTSADQVSASLSAAKDNPSRTTLNSVVVSVKGLGASAKTLQDSVSATC
jgi:hypothetical protein